MATVRRLPTRTWRAGRMLGVPRVPTRNSPPVTAAIWRSTSSRLTTSSSSRPYGAQHEGRLLLDCTAVKRGAANQAICARGKPAPVLAVSNFGKGRTLALLTDSAWNWGFAAANDGRGRSARGEETPARATGDDGRALQRFWEGAIRWLVRDPALTLLHIDLDRTEYRRGQTVAARVRTLHADYSPAGRIAVTLDLLPAEDASGGTGAAAKTLRALTVTTGEDGEAHAELAGLAAGAYRLIGRATLDGRAVEEQTTFVLRPEGRELDDVVSRDEVLRQIAAVTGGEFRVGTLGTPSIRPARQVRVGSLRTVAIWSHPSLLFLALALLASEWMLRRRAGHG